MLPNRFSFGRYKSIDINGDNVINSDDRTFIGSTLPKLEYEY
jgi:hypothetical protein